MTAGRAKRLALQEAYRPITVREGDEVRTLVPIAQDRTGNSDLGNLQDRPKSTPGVRADGS